LLQFQAFITQNPKPKTQNQLSCPFERLFSNTKPLLVNQ
jgi:hypothetical protein